MRSRIKIPAQVFLATVFLPFPCLVFAQGAAPASLQEQLQAQYTLVQMGADSSGPAVIQAGTILKIQKGGILGVPYDNLALYPAKYEGGTLHPPAVAKSNSATAVGQKMCGLFGKCNSVKDQANKQSPTKLFQVGDKVYPSKVEVKPDKDTVTLSLISCDSCNNVNPPTYYKSQVVFQFDKGYLAKASPPQIEDVIAQVLAIDDSSDNQQSGNSAQANQGGQGGGQAGGGQPASEQPHQTQSIQIGQTTDQVVAALGQPEKSVNLGPKQIFVYKDLKIIFVNGRVADVQ